MKQLPPGYCIKLAQPEHIAFLNAIEIAAAGIFPEDALPEHILSDCLPESSLLEGMQNGRLWVALDPQGLPAGYALVDYTPAFALLAQMDVHPSHGRKGLGAALVATAAHHMRELGAKALYLTTFSHIPWNAPFYARMGFTPLTGQDMPNELAALLEQEKACGLEQRLAMRLLL